MTWRVRIALLAVVIVAVAAPVRSAMARDDLAPSRAAADVQAAMRERELSFCKEPHRPLTASARALCPHAQAIPDCAGFAEACAATEPVKPDEDSFLARFLRWLARSIPQGLKDALKALARLPGYAVLALVAAMAVAAVFPIARAVRRVRRDAALSEPLVRATTAVPDTPAIEVTDDEKLLALADDHARAGRLEQALQIYLAASLRALDRRGAVRWARDRTNGEYARACSEEPSRGPLREIVREVDRVQFGRVPPALEVVTRAGRLATGIVRWVPLALLLMVAGCMKSPRPGNDPAGNELFHELLRRQAGGVSSLETTLREIPPPRDIGEPALVVDTETTPIDDETRAHLVQWVRAGGDLVLFGAPGDWPRELGAGYRATCAHDFSAADFGGDANRSTVAWPGHLATPAALDLGKTPDAPPDEAQRDDGGAPDEGIPEAHPTRVAWLDDGSTYAASWSLGRGTVLGIASDELTTNAALARPDNAIALVAMLEAAESTAFVLAEPEDGLAGPSSPLTALNQAGLGLGLGHALVAAVILFLAAGIRLAAPRPTPPPRRRAFAEHVEAVGALYARSGAARHALAAYGRFVEQRLRARMPRGATDLAAFLAGRADLPLETCERLLNGASAAAGPEAGDRSGDDDLMVLKELSAAYTAAIAKDG